MLICIETAKTLMSMSSQFHFCNQTRSFDTSNVFHSSLGFRRRFYQQLKYHDQAYKRAIVCDGIYFKDTCNSSKWLRASVFCWSSSYFTVVMDTFSIDHHHVSLFHDSLKMLYSKCILYKTFRLPSSASTTPTNATVSLPVRGEM